MLSLTNFSENLESARVIPNLELAGFLIEKLKVQHPSLGRNGWFFGSEPDPLDAACVGTALAFLKFGPVKLLRTPRASSYEWKHLCERWGRANGLESYVSNGDFIGACIFRDIPMRSMCFRSPNSVLGLKLSAPDLWSGV